MKSLGNLTEGAGFQSVKTIVSSLTDSISQLVTTTSATTTQNKTKEPVSFSNINIQR